MKFWITFLSPNSVLLSNETNILIYSGEWKNGDYAH